MQIEELTIFNEKQEDWTLKDKVTIENKRFMHQTENTTPINCEENVIMPCSLAESSQTDIDFYIRREMSIMRLKT